MLYQGVAVRVSVSVCISVSVLVGVCGQVNLCYGHVTSVLVDIRILAVRKIFKNVIFWTFQFP